MRNVAIVLPSVCGRGRLLLPRRLHPVRGVRFNHVSIHADDVEASARFYEELFGMERLPTPNLGGNVLWLRLGEQQLHVFERDTGAPRYHHFALDVDDFEAVYRKAEELGLLDGSTFGSPVRELPDGSVQMYIRDPSGNLLEIDWPDVSTLDRSVFSEVPRLADDFPQPAGAESATLYHARGPGRTRAAR